MHANSYAPHPPSHYRLFTCCNLAPDEMEHQDTASDAQEMPSGQHRSSFSSHDNLHVGGSSRTLPPRNVKRLISLKDARARTRSVDDATSTCDEPHPAEPRTKRLPAIPISLARLATQYSQLLPQQIQVTRGRVACEGVSTGKERGGTVVSTSDLINIHSVQSRETIDISVSPYCLFKVPTNSAITFSLLYPGGELVFCGVRDVIAADPVPKIICTQNVYLVAGEGPMCNFSAGEVLAPRGELVFVDGYECMEVHSFTTGGKKYLTMDNGSSFTTEESKIGLSLSDLLHHVEGLFPNKVKMHIGQSQIPMEEVYTLHSRESTVTLIGTREGSDEIIEIAAEDEVDVIFVPQTRDSAGTLRAKNRRVLERMSACKMLRFTSLLCSETDVIVNRMLSRDCLYDDVLCVPPATSALYAYDYVEQRSTKLETIEPYLRPQARTLERTRDVTVLRCMHGMI